MESKIFSRLTAWQNWIFQRPNAVGEAGALRRYGTGQKAAVRYDESVSGVPGAARHACDALQNGTHMTATEWVPALRRTASRLHRVGTRDRTRSTPMNIMNVDYSTKIPNNVNLSEDRQVLKALEGWHPGYMDWWSDMGPEGFQQSLVYLRTAYSVDPRGWAKFDYVKMPDYRWGILLAAAGRETASSRSARILASRHGRKYRANTAPRCAG